MADHVKVLQEWLRQVQGRLDYHAGRSPHGPNPSTVAERDALTAAISAMTESDRLAAAHEAEVAERNVEVARLTEAIQRANSQTEDFERRYYLESDRADAAVALLRECISYLPDRGQQGILKDEAMVFIRGDSP